MIELKEFCKNLEEKLDAAFASSGANSYFSGMKWKSSIVLDAREYKKPTREKNEITNYINGLFEVIGSELEGKAPEIFNASISANLYLALPMRDIADENGENEFCALLLAAIRKELSTAWTDEIVTNAESGDFATVTVQPRLADATTKDTLPMIGEALIVTVYLDYTLTMRGQSGNDYVISYYTGTGWETIPYATLNFVRRVIADGNIPMPTSGASPVSKVTPKGTQLTIAITLASRLRYFDNFVTDFEMDGSVEPISIRITRPKITKDAVTGLWKKTEKTKTYSMIIEESSSSAVIGGGVGGTVKFAEYFGA